MTSSLRRLLILLTAALFGTALFATPSSAAVSAAPPQLISWSSDAGPYRLGDLMVFRFEVSNPEQLHRIEVIYRENTTHQFHAFGGYWDQTLTTTIGTVSYTVPSDHIEGPNSVTYYIEAVRIQDHDGRWSYYYGDGSFGSDVLPGGSHGVNLTSKVSFVDTGRDYTPPVLHSLSISSLDVGVNEELTVNYSASDPNLATVMIDARDQLGLGVSLVSDIDHQTPLPGIGSAKWSLDRPDKLTLRIVTIVDVYGNIARYYPDGRVTWGQPYYSTFEQGTHQISMPTTPIIVRPEPVTRLAVQTASGTARLKWTQQADLGYRVVVSPGGRVITGEAGATAREVVISGLPIGVRHTFSVTTTGHNVESRPTTVRDTPRWTRHGCSARGTATGTARPTCGRPPR